MGLHRQRVGVAKGLALPISMPQPIHVLGSGALGQLFAFYLRRHGNEVKMMFRDAAALQRFRESGARITLSEPGGGQPLACAPLDAEAHSISSSDSAPIQTLVLATKSHQAVAALQALRPRLTAASTLVLLQNGVLRLMEELREQVFNMDEQHRPGLVLCSVTHGAYNTGPFSVVHAGRGQCTVASTGPSWQLLDMDDACTTAAARQQQPQAGSSQEARTAPHAGAEAAVWLLASIPELRAERCASPSAMLRQLLLKLGVNCCINPLTALLGCRNGALLEDASSLLLIDCIAGECAEVLSQSQWQRTAPAGTVPSAREFAERAKAVAAATAHNRSSMLQDLQACRPTEIDYLNGYIVQQAERLGAGPAPWNQAMTQLVSAKTRLAQLSGCSASPAPSGIS